MMVAPEGTKGKSRRFHFVYEAKINPAPSGAKQQRIWLPVPQSNEYQEISNLKFTSPQVKAPPQFHYDAAYGNKIAYFELENPKEEVLIKMEFDTIRYEHTRNQAPQKPESRPQNPHFLQPTRLVLVNDQTKKEAEALTQGKTEVREKLKACYDYVLNKVKYDKPKDSKGSGLGDGWGDGATTWAQEKCYGNCTDFHALYLSLLRSLGIPCRFEIGAWLHDDGKTTEGVVGYHCWALSWDEKNGWFPVDISEGWKGSHQKNKPELAQYYFGNHCVNRVQFTMERDIVLTPKAEGQPLNYFVYPYSEVEGNSVPTTADRKSVV